MTKVSTPATHVVDAVTGEPIRQLISIDEAAGTIRRYAIDGDDNLVRENDVFVVIEETRAVLTVPIAPADADTDGDVGENAA